MKQDLHDGLLQLADTLETEDKSTQHMIENVDEKIEEDVAAKDKDIQLADTLELEGFELEKEA